jgi:class 3 adenylate cyclase
MENIEDWLNRLGLGQYAQRFAENYVDAGVLSDLTDQDLASLGIPLGHRKRILRAITDLAPLAGEGPGLVRQDNPERRQLTVVFCDLVGSTALSERLDPEDMREVIGAYQGACASVIPKYEGFISQYLGDGILVYFGYPRAHEDAAERAVRASLEMIKVVTKLTTPARAPLRMRVGIATGIVVVGDVVGDGASQQHMAVGPTPNLAARLQAIADPDSVVVADSTRRLLGDVFALRETPALSLKGIAESVTAWVVEGVSQNASRFDAAHSVRLTRFVGREKELDMLLDRQTRAWQGNGQVVVISGEAGIGKSRLTGSLDERSSVKPHARLRYQCSPYHTGSALYPFVRQIEQAAGLLPDDLPEQILDKLDALTAKTPRRGKDVVPLLAALFSSTGGLRRPVLGLSASQQRRRTFAVLVDQLHGLTALGPILVQFEDVHWADATSLELIDLVIERIRKLPVLLLITARPDFKLPWKEMENLGLLELGRLERASAETIIDCVTGGRSLPAEVRDQIIAKTDGVPLFVEELTKAVLEAGILIQEEGRYRLAGPLPPLAIPATLHDSLMARLDRLGAAKDVAQVGAAIGRQFSYALLEAVMGRNGDDMKTALFQLETADLIVSLASAPEATYRFKHALVQDTAYESLLRGRRQVVHHRIAEAIRDRFPVLADAQPEIMAHHYSHAGLGELAITWWVTASEWARSRSAYAEAVAHLQKALNLAADLPVTPESRALLLKVQLRYGRTLLAAKGWASNQVTEAFARAKELAAEVNDVSQRIAIDFALWYCNFTQGARLPLGPSSEAFLSTARSAPSDPLSIQLTTLVTFFASWFGGDFVGAREYAEARFRYLNSTAEVSAYLIDLDPHVTVRLYLALILWPLGDVHQATKYKEESLALAIQKGDAATLANTLGHCCYFEAFSRNFSKAHEHAETLLRLCQEHRLEGWIATAKFYIGLGCFYAPEPAAGMAQMMGAAAQATKLGVGLWAPFNASLLAEAEAHSIGVDAGIERLDSALAEIQRSGLCWIEAELHRARAELLQRRLVVDPEAVEVGFTRALQTSRDQNARTMELRAALGLARFYHSRERVEAAREVLMPAAARLAKEQGLQESAEATELLDLLS